MLVVTLVFEIVFGPIFGGSDDPRDLPPYSRSYMLCDRQRYSASHEPPIYHPSVTTDLYAPILSLTSPDQSAPHIYPRDLPPYSRSYMRCDSLFTLCFQPLQKSNFFSIYLFHYYEYGPYQLHPRYVNLCHT